MVKILKQSDQNSKALRNASAHMNILLGELETAEMFAQAGTMDPDEDNSGFRNYREGIVIHAKAVVNGTKDLVAFTRGGHGIEKVIDTVKISTESVEQLLTSVKSSASSLGSEYKNIQVLLLESAKKMTVSVITLIKCLEKLHHNSIFLNSRNCV